jgi:hypothetical protein
MGRNEDIEEIRALTRGIRIEQPVATQVVNVSG